MMPELTDDDKVRIGPLINALKKARTVRSEIGSYEARSLEMMKPDNSCIVLSNVQPAPDFPIFTALSAAMQKAFVDAMEDVVSELAFQLSALGVTIDPNTGEIVEPVEDRPDPTVADAEV